MSSEERRAFAETVFSLCAANLATSIDGGALFERPDGHLSRVPLRVDEQGWSRLVEIFDRALEEVLEVKQEAELRLASRAEDAVPVVAFATCFEMPR